VKKRKTKSRKPLPALRLRDLKNLRYCVKGANGL
jgi:hypothetical protein